MASRHYVFSRIIIVYALEIKGINTPITYIALCPLIENDASIMSHTKTLGVNLKNNLSSIYIFPLLKIGRQEQFNKTMGSDYRIPIVV